MAFLFALVLIVVVLAATVARRRRVPSSLAAGNGAKRSVSVKYEKRDESNTAVKSPQIEPLPDFDWQATPPTRLRPFRPTYNITMGMCYHKGILRDTARHTHTTTPSHPRQHHFRPYHDRQQLPLPHHGPPRAHRLPPLHRPRRHPLRPRPRPRNIHLPPRHLPAHSLPDALRPHPFLFRQPIRKPLPQQSHQPNFPLAPHPFRPRSNAPHPGRDGRGRHVPAAAG